MTEVQTDLVPIVLLSSFFVFNIKYPKCCTNFYTFLELTLLDKNASREQLATTVSNFFYFHISLIVVYLVHFFLVHTTFLHFTKVLYFH